MRRGCALKPRRQTTWSCTSHTISVLSETNDKREQPSSGFSETYMTSAVVKGSLMFVGSEVNDRVKVGDVTCIMFDWCDDFRRNQPKDDVTSGCVGWCITKAVERVMGVVK